MWLIDRFAWDIGCLSCVGVMVSCHVDASAMSWLLYFGHRVSLSRLELPRSQFEFSRICFCVVDWLGIAL